jgi:response regulator NasT
MTNLQISEPEAFKWMQKTAMDKRRSMTDVAQLVMDEFEKN